MFIETVVVGRLRFSVYADGMLHSSCALQSTEMLCFENNGSIVLLNYAYTN